jgi:ankyrin repeat protein
MSATLRLFVLVSLCVPASAQDKVDFARDIQPLLRQNCQSCHGAVQQMAGLRLDRRSSAFKAGTRRVVPGSSDNSYLYLRASGSNHGPQMPPTGAMSDDQIELVKRWIDQGAQWPDSLANETDLPPVNPKAAAVIETLRTRGAAEFLKQVTADPKLLNERGPEGSSPFMFAAWYTDPATIAKLIKMGADPNQRNDAKATALIWVAHDPAKAKVLIDAGADVNARSEDARTPLMLAARHPGGQPVVKLLLEKGANPNPNKRPQESSPLIEALELGNAEVVKMLLDKGADVKATGPIGLILSVVSNCPKCFDQIAPQVKAPPLLSAALAGTSVLGDLRSARYLIEHGADVNAFDQLGRSVLMNAAANDHLPVELVKLLIEKGADVNAVSKHQKSGDAELSVLDVALLRGETPVVELLRKAGAKSTRTFDHKTPQRSGNTIRAAVQSSIPQLQLADANFIPKAACASCHNDSLEAMAMSEARKKGFQIDEKAAGAMVKANVFGLQMMGERLRQGYFSPVVSFFSDFVLGYMLVGLHAEGYQPDIQTDTAVMYIKRRQQPTGEWSYPISDARPPICNSYVAQTALAMRSLQLYAPAGRKPEYEKSVQLASTWLAKVTPRNTEDMGWKVLGLAWAGTQKTAQHQAMKELVAIQRADGGWGDIPTLPSSAYSTGKVLYSLHKAGMSATDAAYKRGVDYLLKTQHEDGTWFVKTRALALQPHFDTGYPHGYDQWISAAGSSWATMALAIAAPAPKTQSASLK